MFSHNMPWKYRLETEKLWLEIFRVETEKMSCDVH